MRLSWYIRAFFCIRIAIGYLHILTCIISPLAYIHIPYSTSQQVNLYVNLQIFFYKLGNSLSPDVCVCQPYVIMTNMKESHPKILLDLYQLRGLTSRMRRRLPPPLCLTTWKSALTSLTLVFVICVPNTQISDMKGKSAWHGSTRGPHLQ